MPAAVFANVTACNKDAPAASDAAATAITVGLVGVERTDWVPKQLHDFRMAHLLVVSPDNATRELDTATESVSSRSLQGYARGEVRQ